MKNDLLFQIEWEYADPRENIESVDTRGYHFYAIIAAPKINGELIVERGNILYIGRIPTNGYQVKIEENIENRINTYMDRKEHLNEQNVILLGKVLNDKFLEDTNKPLEDIKQCLICDNPVVEDIQEKPIYTGKSIKIENKNYYLPLKPRNCCVPPDIT